MTTRSARPRNNSTLPTRLASRRGGFAFDDNVLLGGIGVLGGEKLFEPFSPPVALVWPAHALVVVGDPVNELEGGR